jgi:uncharacterized protein YndB with AHSA1/START domain
MLRFLVGRRKEGAHAMDVEVNVRERVLKPIGEVFAAIVDPARLSQYFTSRSSGPLKAGTTVLWDFADVGVKGVPVDVIEVEENGKIVFEGGSPRTRTTIRLAADDPDATVVTINEATFPFDEEGVKRAMGQTGGWTYFLACLKAHVQHGINLRAGLNKRITDV